MACMSVVTRCWFTKMKQQMQRVIYKSNPDEDQCYKKLYIMSLGPSTVDLPTLNCKSLGIISYLDSSYSMQASTSKGNVTESLLRKLVCNPLWLRSQLRYLNCGGPLITVEVKFWEVVLKGCKRKIERKKGGPVEYMVTWKKQLCEWLFQLGKSHRRKQEITRRLKSAWIEHKE